jgi:hypothetical protein
MEGGTRPNPVQINRFSAVALQVGERRQSLVCLTGRMVKANTPLPADSYVPILKGKMAEYGALESCDSERVVPLLELLAPESAAVQVTRAWQRDEDVLWVHALNFEDKEEADFANGIEKLFSDLRGTVQVVPVITVTEGPDTLDAIARIISVDQRGVVLRIEAEDILDQLSDTAADIDATLAQLGIQPANVDFVIDAGLVSGSATVRAAVADQCLRSLPHLDDWRSVVIAFSAFPAAISTLVPASSVRAIPREDAAAFTATKRGAGRALVFGDYAIGVPTYSSVPFAPIPNIRYASEQNWIIHRAKEKKNPSDQYRALASALTSASYYSGPTFSPGDQQIMDVATAASGPGNAMTHLRAGVSRHLHVVLERLATLGEP